MAKAGFIALLFILITGISYSQGPCYLPGQTPPLAIPVCGTTAFVQDSVSICDGMTIPVPCFDGIDYLDKNSFWYKFHCFQSGVLGFLVVPNNPTDDYDWMLFDVTGKNPMAVYTDTTCIVAYNWSGVVGNTGTAPNTLDSNSCASATDTTNGGIVTPNQTKMPLLLQGHDYLLMVSHFTNTQVGYQITFGGGNAVITDTLMPFMKYARAICDGSTMVLVTNKKMRCTSLDANGSDFSLSPPSASIISAVGNCYGGFDFDTVYVKLSNPLPPGNYSLVVNLGADGNTLEDICYNNIPVGSKIPVHVYPMGPTPMDSFKLADSCNPSSVQLVFRRPMKCSSVAPDGSDFVVTGPSAVTVSSADIVCNSDSTTAIIIVNFSAPIIVGGNYTIKLQTGSDGNSIIDECGFESIINQTLVFHAAAPALSVITGPSVLCVNQGGTLKNANPNGVWTSSNNQVLSINNNGVINALSADTVTVFYSAVGKNGCLGYVQYLVKVNPTPFVQAIQGGKNICMNNADTLFTTPQGGSWYSMDTTVAKIDSVTGIAVPVSLGNTVIKYNVTNQFGCSDSAFMNVSVNPLPVISPVMGANALCVNNTGLYTDSTPKGIWQLEDTSLAVIDYNGMIYPHGTGVVKIKYTVISRKGCADSVFRNVTINPLPAIAAIAGNKDICVGQSAQMTDNNQGGIWVSANHNLAVIDTTGMLTTYHDGSDSIQYILTVNGCTGSVYDIVNIRPLPFVDTISGPSGFCENDSAQYSCIPAGGVWNVLPAMWATIDNAGWLKAINSGSIMITYTVTNSFGCSDSVRKILTIKPMPLPDFKIPTNICMPGGMGYFTNLTSPLNPSNSYVWDFGDASNPVLAYTTNPVHQFIAPIPSAGYIIKLKATSIDNCSAEKTKLLPAAYIHPQPGSAMGTIPDPATVCLGTGIQFYDNSIGTTVAKSVWYLGNNQVDSGLTDIYTYTYPGTYWVTHNIVDSFGCISTLSQAMVTIDSFPVVSAGNTQYVQLGSSVVLTPAIIADSPTIKWTPDIFLNKNTILNPVCTPLHDTTYTLSVWNEGGCMSQDTVRIIVLGNIEIPNAFSPNGDRFFDTWLIPGLSKYPTATVLIFNRYGQKIFESKNGYPVPWNGTYNGTRVPVGVYFYVIKRNESLPVLSGPVSVFW